MKFKIKPMKSGAVPMNTKAEFAKAKPVLIKYGAELADICRVELEFCCVKPDFFRVEIEF